MTSLVFFGGGLVFLYSLFSFWNWRFDMTQARAYTLSPVTLKVIEEVKSEPIKFVAFFRADSGEREMFKELMECYQPLLRKLEVEIYDPDRSPSKTREYRIDSYGTIIVEFRDRRERVNGIDEEKITNAILRVIRNQRKKLYFLTGHGEFSIANERIKGLSILRQRLLDENYEVDKLVLVERPVPADASCLILAGPKADFEERELTLLDEYLKHGGKIIVLADPVDTGTLKRFEKWINHYGIKLGDDIIVDKLGKALGADFLVPVITQYQDHEITKDFAMTSLLPVARSVSVTEPLPPGVEVQPLAYTGGSSWAESDLENLQKGDAFLDPSKDMKGPVPIAAVSVQKPEAKNEKSVPFKIVVFGDSDFITNANVNVSGNRDLFLNSVAWLAGELTLVSIREKKRADTPLVLQVKDKQMLFWFPTIYVPAAILFAGILVNWVRRKKSRMQ